MTEDKHIPAMLHAMIQAREKVKNLSAENEQLKIKLEKAKKVIQFYASCALEDMWEPPFDGGSKSGSLGDAARAVLKEIGDE